MESIVLQNGSTYTLAVNGFRASESELKLMIVTDESIESISAAFGAKDNTRNLKVVSEDGVTLSQVMDFVEMGDVITKRSNAVISVDVVTEVRDEEGIIVTPAGLKENHGTVVEFSMHKESITEQVKQNRADIDFLLMMEE